MKEICKELEAAIKDENDGIRSYQYLQNELERRGQMPESRIMEKIKMDEIEHLSKVVMLRDKLCKVI